MWLLQCVILSIMSVAQSYELNQVLLVTVTKCFETKELRLYFSTRMTKWHDRPLSLIVDSLNKIGPFYRDVVSQDLLNVNISVNSWRSTSNKIYSECDIMPINRVWISYHHCCSVVDHGFVKYVYVLRLCVTCISHMFEIYCILVIVVVIIVGTPPICIYVCSWKIKTRTRTTSWRAKPAQLLDVVWLNSCCCVNVPS